MQSVGRTVWQEQLVVAGEAAHGRVAKNAIFCAGAS